MPTEPPSSPWRFPPAATAGPDGLLAVGADLAPGTLLAAYRRGIFPMPVPELDLAAWWSPDPRGVLEPADLRITRTLRRSLRRYVVRVDTAFPAVVAACADPGRRGGWITEAVADAYLALHELGWAHSVEAWDADGELAGGLYGVAVGALFAGESMFHRAVDASKVALVGLVERLPAHALLDVQWCTPHLASLGARELARSDYLARLAVAVRAPGPAAWGPARPDRPG